MLHMLIPYQEEFRHNSTAADRFDILELYATKQVLRHSLTSRLLQPSKLALSPPGLAPQFLNSEPDILDTLHATYSIVFCGSYFLYCFMNPSSN